MAYKKYYKFFHRYIRNIYLTQFINNSVKFRFKAPKALKNIL